MLILSTFLSTLSIGCAASDQDVNGEQSGPGLVEIALYQVVEIPVWSLDNEIRPENRGAPLVQDRAAVMVVSVDLPQDWTPQEIQATVELTTAGTTTSYSGTLLVSEPTDLADPSGAILIELPAEAVQADAQYTVTLSTSGESSDQFPETGLADLGPVATGAIRVHLVPYEIDGFVPDTSQAVLDGYRDAVQAVYPSTEVIITLGELMPDVYGGQADIGAILIDLGVLQEQVDQAPHDVYYFGLVSGVQTREEFEGSTGISESGFGDRAMFAVGAAFADQKSQDTLIHELGHMHGLHHAPCGDPGDVDVLYPYAGGEIGVMGYDFRTQSFVPADHADMMGYCYPRWISDYNYESLVSWVQLSQTW